MNEKTRIGQKPSALKLKYGERYILKPGLKRKIWLAFKAYPYSPNAQVLCEDLFLRPLRERDYGHFHKICDTLKAMDKRGELDADRPPEAKDYRNQMIDYAFPAAEYWLQNPPSSGEWSNLRALRKVVKELALKKWAAVQIWGPHMGHRDFSKLPATDEKAIAKELRETWKENGPKGTNWNRIWEQIGLMSLKDIYPDARQRSLTASTASAYAPGPEIQGFRGCRGDGSE